MVDRPTISGQFLGRFHAHSLPNKLRMPVSTVTSHEPKRARRSARSEAARHFNDSTRPARAPRGIRRGTSCAIDLRAVDRHRLALCSSGCALVVLGIGADAEDTGPACAAVGARRHCVGSPLVSLTTVRVKRLVPAPTTPRAPLGYHGASCGTSRAIDLRAAGCPFGPHEQVM